jgi:PadR family transcriptional regulator, regulatory protein AphA
MQQLTPTARVILGMLGLGARTGYEIKQVSDASTRFFWGASYGQIYPELRRLADAGLVEAEDDPAGGRKRTAYRLTDAGRQALLDWLLSDAPMEYAMRAEGLLKLFFGGLLQPEQVLENVRAWRGELERSLAFFRAEIEPLVRTTTTEYPYLVYQYGLELLEWNVAWCRRAERRLSRQARSQPRPPSETPAADRP